MWKEPWRGQRQTWFLARFLGEDEDVNIDTADPEFRAWKWAEPAELPALIVPFKKKLYEDVLDGVRGVALAARPALERWPCGAFPDTEAAAVERCADAPMLDQVDGLGGGQQRLAQPRRAGDGRRPARRRLCGAARRDRARRRRRRSRRWRADGALDAVAHGRNLHLKVRPEAPVQLLFTGHMDTVFGADHPFQKRVLARGRACSAGPASPT